MIIRVQFWVRYLGRVDVLVNSICGTADQLAKNAVTDAIVLFNNKWPGTHRDDLHVVGAEEWTRP